MMCSNNKQSSEVHKWQLSINVIDSY